MAPNKVSRRAFASASIALMVGARTILAQEGSDDHEAPSDLSVDNDDLYPQRDWTDGRSGQINLSSFSFRDMDRDGEYSVGDFPYLGVKVRMTAPDGVSYMQSSNRNGFSNFVASTSNPEASIQLPGEYVFTILPPNGWHVTTHNQTQSVTVTEAPGSIGGVVMDHLPHPFGIAPALEIRGNANALSEAFEDSELIAVAPDGSQIPVEPEEDGSFTLPATSGDWLIGGARGTYPPRLVPVGVHPVVVSSVVQSIPAEERAGSTTVGFDDLSTGSNLRKVPNGYGGLNWSGLNAISNLFSTAGEGYVNCTQSGEYVAYSSSGHPVQISRDREFDFIGGYFGIAWPAAEGETIHVRAYRGDTPVAEDMFRGSSYGAVYFSANYRGITSLEFTTEHFWQFVADDLEFIVPE